jgi:hypothetical protein
MRVTLPRFGIDADYLIQRVEIQDFTGTRLRYGLTCMDGEPFGTWQDFFKKLSNAKPFLLRENEVLMLLRTFPETINAAETFAQSTTAHACGRVGDVINFTEVCLS